MSRRLVNGKRRVDLASGSMLLTCPTAGERIAALQHDPRVRLPLSLTSERILTDV
jgi:hypothetical protein